MKIYKPTHETLALLLAEATKKQTVEQYRETFIAAIKKIAGKDQLRYRSYGPYWWLVKKGLIARGNFGFGEYLDEEWISALDYGIEELNFIAAFAYEDVQFQHGIYIAQHVLEDSEGEPIEYICNDHEMEALAASQSLGGKLPKPMVIPVSEMLTPTEIEQLRQEKKEHNAFAKQKFAQLRGR